MPKTANPDQFEIYQFNIQSDLLTNLKELARADGAVSFPTFLNMKLNEIINHPDNREKLLATKKN